MAVQKPAKHGRDHAPGGEDPIPLPGEAVYSIKVFRDDTVVETGDGQFIFEVPEDLDGGSLIRVEGYVTTVSSSGGLSVQIRNITQAHDMLSSAIAVDVSELNSKDASSQPAVNSSNATVAWGDQIAVDVDSAGTGAKGLGVILYFTSVVDGFFIVRGPEGIQGDPGPAGDTGPQGPQGEPGGIVAWSGAWDSGTTYAENDAVSWNGSSYVAIQASTDVEPGVDSGWESYWMVLASGGGSGTGMSAAVTQTGHGLSAGDVIRFNGSGYVLAQADSAENAEVVGIVSEVTDADHFTLQMGGSVSGLSGLTAGTVYFLSASSAGALTATEPTTIGYASKPLLIADSTTSGYLFNWRGNVVSGATAAQADGWTYDDAATWTYASATTFTVAGDQTVKFSKGTRIKLTQTTVKYFVVVGSSAAGGTTTVTITGGSDYSLANAGITSPFYSYAINPQGYPTYFNYATTWTGSSSNPAIGDGNLAFQFSIVGDVVEFELQSAMGSTTTYGSGIWFWSLPSASAAYVRVGGDGYVYDASTGDIYPMIVQADASGKFTLLRTAATTQFVNPTTPITFTQTDSISITGRYRMV